MNYGNFIITAQLLIEQIDELQSSRIFRHKIKQLSKSLANELEKEIKVPLNSMYKEDEGIVHDVSRSTESLIKLVAEMDLADTIAFNQIFLQYKKDKEGFIDRNKIMLTECI